MMIRYFRLAVAAVLVAALFAFAAPTMAAHEHWLETPGTCVVDIGRGQTAIADPDLGGFHRFHTNVHTGTPGMTAFQIENNPVSVGKGAGCPE